MELPEGDLAVDQRHRARWANYTPASCPGLTLSVLQALESGVPYAAGNTNGVDPRPVTNPNNAYETPPASTTTTYFFGPRDEFHTEGQIRTDFAANYVYRFPGASRMQLFGQLQVLNVFNQFQPLRVAARSSAPAAPPTPAAEPAAHRHHGADAGHDRRASPRSTCSPRRRSVA